MAAGRYSKIHRRMWSDDKFRNLSRPQPCGQSLWLRLLCGPELGPIPGLFAAREPGLADAMGWELKPFRQSFNELSSNGLAKADWQAGLVFVPNAVKYNEPANPNVVQSWADTWAELPECELKSEAHSTLCAYLKVRGESFLQVFLNHCPNHSANHCPNQEQEQEQDQEQDQEQEEYCAEPAEPAPALVTFPCSGKPCAWGMNEEHRAEWAVAYPGVDVLGEARKALAWVNANPTKRKTARGMAKFLLGWMGRVQNSGGSAGWNRPPPAPAQQSLRVGHVRAEDFHHSDKTGEVDL
jgi:hypothetical protein